MIELTHRNTRRYGGYLVHMGIVLMFIGFTGAASTRTSPRKWRLADDDSAGALHAAHRG